jgi:hypothetical protein
MFGKSTLSMMKKILLLFLIIIMKLKIFITQLSGAARHRLLLTVVPTLDLPQIFS